VRVLASSALILAGVVTVAAGRAGAEGSVMTRLTGAPTVLPAGARDTGSEVDLGLPISGEIALAPADPGSLQTFVHDVSSPSSPLYRHYLARGEFGARFGAAPDTVSAVERWLDGQGITKHTVDAGRLAMRFTAPAAQVEDALAVRIHRYRLRSSATVYAPAGVPAVPADLRAAIVSVSGLTDWSAVRPLALSDAATVSSGGPTVSSATPSGAALAGGHIRSATTAITPCPAATSEAAASGGYTQDQLARAYDFGPLYTQGRFGAGVTVAVFELEPFAPNDIARYQSCMGTSASVTAVPVDGGPSPGAGLESALDIDQLVGLAPQAQVLVYQGPISGSGPVDVYRQIANEDRAQIVSTSWGECESDLGPGPITSESFVFSQMAAQGQSVFAATGDSGSEDCYSAANGSFDTSLATDDPASQPHVTGVGGTSLTSLGPPPAEVVWNNCQGQLASLCAANGAGGAGGGGTSSVWAKPSFQSGTGNRTVPDVAASADPYHGAVVYFNGSWNAVGGTSAGSPLWAALAALADQGCFGAPWGPGNKGSVVGEFDPKLYPLAALPSQSVVHDVVSGNNDYTDTYGGASYPALTGYDRATGWGSPDAAALVAALQPAGGCVGRPPVVAVQGPGHALWLYWESADAKWHGPLGVGSSGSTLSAPSLAYGPNGLPAVAVQGPGNALWLYWETADAQWHGPLGVGSGGSTSSAPSLAFGPNGLPVATVQGPDHALWLYWESADAKWHGPLGVGSSGSTLSAPSLAFGPNGLPAVAVQGPGNALWLYWETADAQWHGPLGVGSGGSTASTPSIGFGANGLAQVAVQGPGNALWLYWASNDAKWHGPLGVGTGGSSLAAPALGFGVNGLPIVATEGPAQSLWFYWESADAQWHGPLGVGATGSVNATPSFALNVNGQPQIAVQGPANSLWLYWETSDALWHGPLGVGTSGSTFARPSLASG
jgi:hypothetical protein